MRIPCSTGETYGRLLTAAWKVLQVVALALACVLLLSFDACRQGAGFHVKQVSFGKQTAAVPSIQVPSKCFWTTSADSPSFSWEVVAHGTVGNSPLSIATCNNTDPATGQPAVVDGQRVILVSKWGVAYPNSVLQGCHDTYFDDNVNGECRVRTHCAVEANPCGGTVGPDFPFCVQGCAEVPSDDTTYRVNLEYGDGSSIPNPLNLAPTLYPVADVRTLARNLTPFRPDPNNPNYVAWKWLVPVAADGTWEDNFSTSLQTMRVRALLGNRPLSLVRVDVGETSSGARSHCSADSDDTTQITAAQCSTLLSLLPSFRNVTPPTTQPAIWQLTLADATDPDNKGLSEQSPVMIEFTLINQSGSQSGPQIAPSQVEFGIVPYQASKQILAAVTITNDKSEPWILDSIGLTGANASDFSPALHGTRTMPPQLSSMDALSIDITVKPSSPGIKQAVLQLPMHTIDHSKQKTFTAQLTANGAAEAKLSVIPANLDFSPRPLWTQLPVYSNWLVANDDSVLDLQLTGVSVTGPDAGMFTVFAIAPNGSKVMPALPILLHGGSAQYFALQFCPTHYGPMSATLQISGNTPGSPQTLSASLPVTAAAPPAPSAICLVATIQPPR
jgi:hypothetical protein